MSARTGQPTSMLEERTGPRPTLAIASSFTCGSLEGSLAFWMDALGIPSRIEIAPYQVFQQLLDPSSLLSRNADGVNVVLVRLEDWQLREDAAEAEGPVSWAEIDLRTKEFAAALKEAARRSIVPYVLCICPASPRAAAVSGAAREAERLEQWLKTELVGEAGVSVIAASDVQAVYPITDWYDAYGDTQGHIPYTGIFFDALGTVIARRVRVLKRAPYKVVVLDCDETLWKGVCGEDGALGIEIDPPRRALQEFMVRQHDRGMLLCLCSKNNEADVAEVFEKRPDMPLRRSHIASWRINWRPKWEGVRSLAGELGLGLDSVIFLDDSPLECAEMQANSPEVLTLTLPSNRSDIPHFLTHVWAFDYGRAGDEDRRRTALYRENRDREEVRARSTSFDEFLANLGLMVRIGSAEERHVARIADLTRRTNQFHTTTIRRSDEEVRRILESGASECLVVDVEDRFGSYGLVGVAIFEERSDCLDVATFLLSCRVLGRGVEHRVVARLAEIARERGVGRVDLRFAPSARNQPALDFLEAVGSGLEEPVPGGVVYRLPVERAAALTQSDWVKLTAASAPKGESADMGSRPMPAPADSAVKVIQRIATNLDSAAKIHQAIKTNRRRPRPAGPVAYVGPRTELERLLCDLWRDTLDVEPIGVQDDFFGLGGTSLQGTMIVNRLQQLLGEVVYIVVLFDAPTVERLAEYLTQKYPESTGRLSGEDTDSERAVEDTSPVNSTDSDKLRSLIRSSRVRSGRPRPAKRNRQAVFILSPPRSGSTLFRVMLAGHPRLFAPPELELLGFETLRERRGAFSGRYGLWLEGSIRAVMEARRCGPDEASRIIADCEERDLPTREFYRLLQEWIPGRTLVDKTPSYALEADVLDRAEAEFEEPLYIHLLRHPAAMIWSFEKARLDQIFGWFAHDFSVRRFAELVWLVSHENILRFLASVPAKRQSRVRFEELVKGPTPVLKDVCRFLNLGFEIDMADPYREGRGRMTDGLYRESRMLGDVNFLAHERVDSGVANQWREQPARSPLGEVTWLMAERLGYERSGDERALPGASGPSARIRPAAAREGVLDASVVDGMSDRQVEILLGRMLGERED